MPTAIATQSAGLRALLAEQSESEEEERELLREQPRRRRTVQRRAPPPSDSSGSSSSSAWDEEEYDEPEDDDHIAPVLAEREPAAPLRSIQPAEAPLSPPTAGAASVAPGSDAASAAVLSHHMLAAEQEARRVAEARAVALATQLQEALVRGELASAKAALCVTRPCCGQLEA